MLSVEQGVAQGCSLYLLYCFRNNLLGEVEEAGLGVVSVGGMLFANDFVGVSDSKMK